MSTVHSTHTAEDMIDDVSHFELWPFTVDTGCPVSDLSEPHLHDFYAIQYVIAGKGTHVIDFQPYDITPHSLYFVSPQQLHLWQPKGELEGFVMAFTEEFLQLTDSPLNTTSELDFFHSVSRTPVLHTTPDQAEIISGLMQTIHTEFTHKNPGYISVIRAYFHIFIVNLQRMYIAQQDQSQEEREPSLLRQFKQMVSKNFIQQLSIQDYADRLGVSVSKLNTTVRSSTQQTPGQIVRKEQVMAAKRLLAHSEMNVAEICFHLNFEDPSYFGRFFKRETGVTPSIFREQTQKKHHHPAG